MILLRVRPLRVSDTHILVQKVSFVFSSSNVNATGGRPLRHSHTHTHTHIGTARATDPTHHRKKLVFSPPPHKGNGRNKTQCVCVVVLAIAFLASIASRCLFLSLYLSLAWSALSMCAIPLGRVVCVCLYFSVDLFAVTFSHIKAPF